MLLGAGMESAGFEPSACCGAAARTRVSRPANQAAIMIGISLVSVPGAWICVDSASSVFRRAGATHRSQNTAGWLFVGIPLTFYGLIICVPWLVPHPR